MRFLHRLRRTLRGDREAADIRDELEFHLEMDVAEGRDWREARWRLGNPERVEDETRAVRVLPWLSSLLRDVRDALRLVRNSPALSLAVVLSLGLGIGANTAIFSLIDAAILKPLPVRDPASLVLIEWVSEGFPPGVAGLEGRARRTSDNRMASSLVAESFYRRLAESRTGFDALIGMTGPEGMAVAVDDRPAERTILQYVSGNYFRDLGVVPVLGRGFLDEEDEPGQAPAVVVSHRFWTSRLGRAPDVLGRTVRVEGVAARVVGVAPRGFFGFQRGVWTDVYAPLSARLAFESEEFGATIARDDTFWWVSLIGRLNDAVPEATARERIGRELAGLARGIAPGADASAPLQFIASPASRGFDSDLEDREVRALWILQWLVGALLLIVCANVANLLLSRSVGAQRESALRLALGAARARLFQKSLVESALLALLGGVVGLFLGYVLANLVQDLFQAGAEGGNRFDLGVDLRMVGWALMLSLVTTLLFGLVPAIRATHARVGEVLKTRTRSVFGGGLRLPRVLVSMQIALCLAALTSAGLLARSLNNLADIDIGIDVEGLSYATLNPWSAGYTFESGKAYLDAVRGELQSLPGVESVSLMDRRVLDGSASISPAGLPGQESAPADLFDMTDAVHVVGVGPGAFGTLGIEFSSGRALNDSDEGNVVVDEPFVAHFFGEEPAIGKRIRMGNRSDYVVVGIVEEVPWGRLREDDLPVVYTSRAVSDPRTFGGARVISLAIRSRLNPSDLATQVRSRIASVDPAVVLVDFQTQQSLLNGFLRIERLLAFVSGSFGFWALVLAAIGLGGLLTYAAARRTGEIGVRMALGASPARVVEMVLRDSLAMVAIGVLIGLPCAFAAGRVLESVLFGLESTDLGSTFFAILALTLVALGASWLPACRAARIDPMSALREQ